MKNFLMLLLCVLSLTIFLPTAAFSAPQTLCPVMNNPINKEIYVDHEGQRIYFCCPGCDGTFKKEPQKFLNKMKEAGVTPESINKPQTLCPVMGNPIDKKIFVDHLGQRIYFCCAGCPPMFKKEPQKFLDKLKKAGVTPESINKPQTLCPVMGNPIDKKIFVDHLGQRIYFCCAGCPPIFKKAPDKYLDQMKEAGIVVEVLEKAEVDHSQHNH